MRTTVNIDDDLLTRAKWVASRTNRTLGDVIDDALRVLLVERHSPEGHAGTVILPVDGHAGFRPGVDLEDKDAVAELLGENELDHVDR